MDHWIKRCGALLAAGFIIAGCQTNTTKPSNRQAQYIQGENIVLKYTGEGLCLKCFNSYRSGKKNKAFAMSTGGAFSYYSNQSSVYKARSLALKSCQRANKNQRSKPCKLLMVNNRFVWK